MSTGKPSTARNDDIPSVSRPYDRDRGRNDAGSQGQSHVLAAPRDGAPPSSRSQEMSFRFCYDRQQPQAHTSRGPFSDLRSGGDAGDRRDHREQRGQGSDRDRRHFSLHDSYQPPRGDFTFREERPPGVGDSYRPSRHYDEARGSQTQNARGGRAQHYNFIAERRLKNGKAVNTGKSGRGGTTGKRGKWVPSKHPADRDLLYQKHGMNGEAVLGDVSKRATYREVEAAMDISGSSESENDGPTKKRARTSATIQEQAIPKWCNPDAYSAIPPPAPRKKTDVLQLIRNARIEADSKKPVDDTAAADFISFELTDSNSDRDCDSDVITSANPTHAGQTKTSKSANATQQGQESKCGNNDASAPDASSQAPAPPANARTGPRSGVSFSLPPRPANGLTPRDYSDQAPPLGNVTRAYAKATGARSAAKSKQAADLKASASLGSLKRTFDGSVKSPHALLKKASKMKSQGSIFPAYCVEPGEDPCPWAKTDHSATPVMSVRLHKELVDFFEYVRPRDFEEKIRGEMISHLETVVKRKWADARILAFGSYKSGLYLPTADMDLVICSQQFLNGGPPKLNSTTHLFQLRSHLQRQKIAFENDIEVVSRAKVPLIKYCDDYTALKVDISFEKLDGVKAVKTFLDWKVKYPAMPVLVSLIKHFLAVRGLNEPVNGGIGGFSVICLVVNLLNHMPQVQSGTMIPEHHLGEVLIEFFDLYGRKFDYKNIAIRMEPPGYVHKSQVTQLRYRNNGPRLSIIDPNRPDNDISGGSSNFDRVVWHFERAYKSLTERMIELAKGPSEIHGYSTILACLLAHNYDSFRCQRMHMERLAKGEGRPRQRQASPQPIQW